MDAIIRKFFRLIRSRLMQICRSQLSLCVRNMWMGLHMFVMCMFIGVLVLVCDQKRLS